MATMGTLGGQDRREQLAALLTRDGAIRLENAARDLRVSAMTVRRDLLDMENAGLLRRVRGGAVPLRGPRPFSERRTTHSRAKAVIAQKALALVPDSGAVALDASSTAGTLGACIGERDALVVATNSYENFTSVRQHSRARAVLVGGEIEEHTDSFVGLIACQAASAMLYVRFFTSASAVDSAHGSSEVTLAEAQVKRAFADSAAQTVLCIDSSKFEQQDVALCFAWERVAVLVTELDPADARLDLYRDLVEIL